MDFPHSRGTSIKTRIETRHETLCNLHQHIQEAHPLKQGLKLFVNVAGLTPIMIQEAHPLKQGLKQSGNKRI